MFTKRRFRSAGRNRLSAESWLGGDNRLGRLNMWGGAAWLSGLVATLALLPELVLPNPEGCLAQPSNLGFGLVPELPIPAPLRCGEG